MRNRVHHSVQAVNISPNPHRLFLNPRINLRNRLDRRIHALGIPVNLLHEVGESSNPEINPLAKVPIREISQLEILLCIEPTLFLESGHGVVVKAGPRVFPPVEVRHPVRDVYINPVNPRPRNLPHPFHINLSPLRRIRTHPNILIPFANPESAPAPKNCRLSRNLPLHPVWMFLVQSVRSLIRVSRNALRPSDINESVIPRRVRLLSHGVNSLQLLLGINKTLIPPLNVVVDLDPKHAIFRSALDNPIRIVTPQPISPDAHIVRPVLVSPVLLRRVRTSQQRARKKHENN